MSELKSCPFCGSEAHCSLYREPEAPHFAAVNLWRVRCTKCYLGGDGYSRSSDAILLWNNRAPDPEQLIPKNAALREALTQLVAVGPDYFGPDKAHLLGGSCCSSMTCEWCQARAALAALSGPRSSRCSSSLRDT
jgi:hypothetical protein